VEEIGSAKKQRRKPPGRKRADNGFHRGGVAIDQGMGGPLQRQRSSGFEEKLPRFENLKRVLARLYRRREDLGKVVGKSLKARTLPTWKPNLHG